MSNDDSTPELPFPRIKVECCRTCKWSSFMGAEQNTKSDMRCFLFSRKVRTYYVCPKWYKAYFEDRA